MQPAQQSGLLFRYSHVAVYEVPGIKLPGAANVAEGLEPPIAWVVSGEPQGLIRNGQFHTPTGIMNGHGAFPNRIPIEVISFCGGAGIGLHTGGSYPEVEIT